MFFSLISHFDRQKFTNVACPLAGANLGQIAASAPNDAWVVGTKAAGAIGTAALTAHWNGLRRRVVPSPNASSSDTLGAVSGIASNDLWAAGRGNFCERIPGPEACWSNFGTAVSGQSIQLRRLEMARYPPASWLFRSAMYSPALQCRAMAFSPGCWRCTGKKQSDRAIQAAYSLVSGASEGSVIIIKKRTYETRAAPEKEAGSLVTTETRLVPRRAQPAARMASPGPPPREQRIMGCEVGILRAPG